MVCFFKLEWNLICLFFTILLTQQYYTYSILRISKLSKNYIFYQKDQNNLVITPSFEWD